MLSMIQQRLKRVGVSTVFFLLLSFTPVSADELETDRWPRVKLTQGEKKGLISQDGLTVTYCCAGYYSSSLASRSHSAGKWYFEAKLKVRKGADRPHKRTNLGILSTQLSSEALMQGPSRYPAKIYHNAAYYVVTWPQWKSIQDGDVFGIAIDLENNKLFVHKNGEWPKGTPSEGRGLKILPGRTWVAVFETGEARDSAAHDQDAWTVNFGAQPFVHPLLPTGYMSYDGNQPLISYAKVEASATPELALPWTRCGKDYKQFCISGRHRPRLTVTLISKGYSVCKAKTGEAIKQLNEASGRTFDVTLLEDSKNNCRAREEYQLAVVGPDTIGIELVPIEIITDASEKGRIDRLVRNTHVFRAKHSSHREYLSTFHPGPVDEPVLQKVLSFKAGNTSVLLAKYSPISSVSVPHYFGVSGDRVLAAIPIWIREERNLKVFRMNEKYFLMMKGLGNVTGYVLELVYEVTPDGIEEVLTNSDWAT